ncbi:hypothetical protein BGX38DRAFT_1264971 [Terfezia claveryi]|nr:hypothetical protein BGX38DRAFT_1264971 [Terfezia claveryi]
MALAVANPPQSISDWYHSCIAAFDKITTGFGNLGPGQDSGGDETKEISLQLVQDQIGRFRVWSRNMGAHYPAHSRMSLDYKLKEASYLQNTVVELLEELNTSLEALCSTQHRVDTIEEVEETDGNDGEKENNTEDDNVSSTESEATESSSDSPLSDLVFRLDDIANIISCLYTLSVAIRRPVPQDRQISHRD